MIVYYFLSAAFIIIKILPNIFIYPLKIVLTFFLEFVFRYRRAVITTNLINSFPNKSKSEISYLRKRYYKVLSRYIVESIFRMAKGFRSLKKLTRTTNVSVLKQSIDKNKPIIVLCSHFGNWELTVPDVVYELDIESYGIYKPVNNQYLNKWLVEKRTMTKLTPVAMKDTLKVMKRNQHNTCLIFLIADQGPANMNNVEWVDFLSQKTPCMNGAKKLSTIFQTDVYYLSTEPDDHIYTSTLKKIDTTTRKDIIKDYMDLLEKDIIKQPEYWLWSHKRWKRAHLYKS